MPGLIGTDEAGYGPNLGPLTVCGTIWQVPDVNVELYELLSSCVTRDARRRRVISTDSTLTICDSKKIYSPSRSIAMLERSVLSVLVAVSGRIPSDSSELAEILGINFPNSANWSVDGTDQNTCQTTKISLPIEADKADIIELAAIFNNHCDDVGVTLSGFDCQCIEPADFNRLVEKFGNKAELLSATTLGIVHRLCSVRNQEWKVVCDKHGGRNKYSTMLNQYLTDQLVTVGSESRLVSQYSWQKEQTKFEIEFRSKGESFLPTALASMVAKYTREVSMEIWNNFWVNKVPGIRPTKGYPVDAVRFKKEIAAAQQELGIVDEKIWRSR